MDIFGSKLLQRLTKQIDEEMMTVSKGGLTHDQYQFKTGELRAFRHVIEMMKVVDKELGG